MTPSKVSETREKNLRKQGGSADLLVPSNTNLSKSLGGARSFY